MSVYGQANDSVIVGAFLVRGQDATPAFEVAPDFESYEFTKLDASKSEDKEFVDDQWAWDKPIVVKGKVSRSTSLFPPFVSASGEFFIRIPDY